MILRVGEVVLVSHYSGMHPFKGVITEVVSNNDVTFKLPKELSITNINEGDPIVIVYEQNSGIYFCECTILNITQEDRNVRIKIDNIDIISDQRVIERFPTSIYVEIKIKGSKKRDIGLMKNISSKGMAVISKMELNEGDAVEFDICVEDTVVLLNANVIWKIQGVYNFEYGLSIVSHDPHTDALIKEYMHLLKIEQEKYIRELSQGTLL